MNVLKKLSWLSLLLITPAFAAPEAFDHYQTGFDLEGAHRSVPCESCHVRGIFKGTPKECGFCHDGTGIYAESARSVRHPLTTENCESCHVVSNWAAIPAVDHVEVLGSCSSCHNGQLAEGMPPDHVQTSQECDICHSDVSWTAVIFDHDGITAGCIGCHNGVDATGKSTQHLPTTNICEDCHSVNFWEPVVTMDHSQVLGACESCHDGQRATGKDPDHIRSSDQCDACHTTQAWLPAGFDHTSVAPGTCAGCHDGQTATGQNSGHFQTSTSCDDCHTTDFWVPHTFMHSGLLFEPLDHRGNLECTRCHRSNSEIVSWTTPAYQPDCAGCHANDYDPGEDDHNGLSLDRNCADSGCHRISDSEW